MQPPTAGMARADDAIVPSRQSNAMAWHTTKVETQDGEVYDLGRGEYPPVHLHPGAQICPACFVVDAWTESETLR